MRAPVRASTRKTAPGSTAVTIRSPSGSTATSPTRGPSNRIVGFPPGSSRRRLPPVGLPPARKSVPSRATAILFVSTPSTTSSARPVAGSILRTRRESSATRSLPVRSTVIPCGRSSPPGTGIGVIRPVRRDPRENAVHRHRVDDVPTGETATAVTCGRRASVVTRLGGVDAADEPGVVVGDVERVSRRCEPDRLVEAGGMHAPSSGRRADEHDPSCRAVRDEHPAARIDDDRVWVAHSGFDDGDRPARERLAGDACGQRPAGRGSEARRVPGRRCRPSRLRSCGGRPGPGRADRHRAGRRRRADADDHSDRQPRRQPSPARRAWLCTRRRRPRAARQRRARRRRP